MYSKGKRHIRNLSFFTHGLTLLPATTAYDGRQVRAQKDGHKKFEREIRKEMVVLRNVFIDRPLSETRLTNKPRRKGNWSASFRFFLCFSVLYTTPTSM